MRQSLRATIRGLFVEPDRRLDIYFYTSSLTKYLHARTVLEQYGINLSHFKSRQDPYEESYLLGKEALLEAAVAEVRHSVGRGMLFFVEDTSLRIEALSGEDDVPGLAVKEWFQRTTFNALDEELRRRGKGRTAVVKSDIALNVPGVRQPVLFHGETAGKVAESPPDFLEKPQYPWLTPKSFNGWFTPDGANKRLGEMSFEESDSYDFRTEALEALVDRLEEYSAILNLSSSAYSVKSAVIESLQPSLFEQQSVVTVVVGAACAGKTTLGNRVSGQRGVRVVDASNIVRNLRGPESDSDAFVAAKALLDADGSDVVARRILELFGSELATQGIVITGFRTIEELECIRASVDQVRFVLVEASERTRFQRHIRRGRDDTPMMFEEFRRNDTRQRSLGLLRVAEDFADVRIVNEGTIQDYWQQIDAVMSGKEEGSPRGVSWTVRPRQTAEHNQLYRCMKVLTEASEPLASKAIATATGHSGKHVLQENVNKVLKNVPELVERVESSSSALVRYKIRPAGLAYVRLTEQQRYGPVRRSSASAP